MYFFPSYYIVCTLVTGLEIIPHSSNPQNPEFDFLFKCLTLVSRFSIELIELYNNFKFTCTLCTQHAAHVKPVHCCLIPSGNLNFVFNGR